MITYLHHKAPGNGDNRVLLIMLPGVGIEAAEFAENGMVAAVHAREPAVDIVAAHPELELYLDGGIVDGGIAAALHRAVIEPALAQGYSRIWLLGISLGGMGALLYASAHEAEVEGIILLAPFLGTRGTMAELAQAGGLAAWSPAGFQAGSPAGSIATDQERRVLLWLQEFLRRRPVTPAIILGHGLQDRFAPGHRMLAEHLPAGQVVTAAGGHDWDTWLTLWRRVLELRPFTGARR